MKKELEVSTLLEILVHAAALKGDVKCLKEMLFQLFLRFQPPTPPREVPEEVEVCVSTLLEILARRTDGTPMQCH